MECYVHIPFCVQKCRYCAFVSFAGKDAFFETYIRLVLKEAELRTDEITEDVTTVYFGGGTPSLLPPPLLRMLAGGLRERIGFDHAAEMTAEANPGTLTEEWLETAASVGVNRLSLGVQAFQPSLLSLLGRIHTPVQASDAVRIARKSGFDNISLDLIFGIPTQTRRQWRETLGEALSLGPRHISAYGLIPEEDTPIYRDLETKKMILPDPEEERDMYDDAIRLFAQHGLRQYEISSFAEEGFECRHNIGYWTQVPYIGLGVSAASMTRVRKEAGGVSYERRRNPDTPEGYQRMIESGNAPDSVERITPEEARFETLMLGLRMNRGISGEEFRDMHGITPEAYRGEKLLALEKKGLLIHEGGSWRMTRRGFDIQNSILLELMDG